MNRPPALVQVYTGDGKGKTTAALGQALRGAGRGWRVAIYQFMKPAGSSGEHLFGPRLAEAIRIIPLGRPRWIGPEPGVDPQDAALAQSGLDQARREMLSGQVDMLVLDELNPAVYFGLIELETALEFIRSRPEEVELVITGRRAPREILALADLITTMHPDRHPFELGVPAREGIEY